MALEEVADDCALLVNDCSPLDDEDAMEEAVDGLFALADDNADDVYESLSCHRKCCKS